MKINLYSKTRQSTLSLWHKTIANDLDQTILKLLTPLIDWYGIGANAIERGADDKKNSDTTAHARDSFFSCNCPTLSLWNYHPYLYNRSILNERWARKSHTMKEEDKSIYFKKKPSISDRVRRCILMIMDIESTMLVVKLATNKVQEDR